MNLDNAEAQNRKLIFLDEVNFTKKVFRQLIGVQNETTNTQTNKTSIRDIVP